MKLKFISERKLSGIMNTVIALVLLSVFQFIQASFDTAIFTSLAFYSDMLYYALLIYLGYSATSNLLFDKTFNKPQYQEVKAQYEERLKLKDIDFDEYLIIENRNRKISVYREMCQSKIYHLEKKLDRSIRNKSRARIAAHITEIKECMTPEYIADNIDSLSVKYNRTYAGDFFLNDIRETRIDSQTNVNFSSTIGKAALKKIGMMIVCTLILSSAAISFIAGDDLWIILLSILIDTMLVLYRAACAILELPKNIERSFIIPYRAKISIIERYVVWRKNNPSETFKKTMDAYLENKLAAKKVK